MKTSTLLPLLIVFLFCGLSFNSAKAQQTEHDIGLGLMAGEPTGLSFKAWTSEINAIDAGLAWSLSGRDAIQLHADYLWHNFDIFGNDVNEGQLPVYYGIGGRLIIYDDAGADANAVFGVRIPLGINYLFEDEPFGLFFEVAPIINLIPDTDFDADAAVGARYYF